MPAEDQMMSSNLTILQPRDCGYSCVESRKDFGKDHTWHLGSTGEIVKSVDRGSSSHVPSYMQDTTYVYSTV